MIRGRACVLFTQALSFTRNKNMHNNGNFVNPCFILEGGNELC